MKLDSQPLVSIVTPVYNGEKYLAECIESVLAQTYENWNYVIVNNCSSDRSLKIAQDYAEKDSRIRIHDNRDFLSMVDNFNHSLLQISPESKYCKVIHADDLLFTECIARMVTLAEENPFVGIVGSYVLEGVRVKCHGLPLSISVLSGREISRLSLLGLSPVVGGLYVFGSPTSLLIRSAIIGSRKHFYSDKYLEVCDQEACYYLLQNVDFGFVHQILTYSRVHNESATSFHEILMRRHFEELMLLKEYGPVYLTRKEHSERLTQRLDKYYRFLAHSAFEGKSKEFWNFHKSGLESLGFPFSWGKVAKRMSKRELVRKSLGWMIHPRIPVSRVLGSLNKREGKTT
jgi:glycosyltransferase involved in cell wall biosynthesis